MEKLKPSINLLSPPSPPGLNQRGYSTRLASGLGQSLGPPAEANPLADVIGQTGPQGFHRPLDQTSQAKLAQPNFVLDRRFGTLRYAGRLPIDPLGFRCLHLC